jgi:hypothetical protein
MARVTADMTITLDGYASGRNQSKKSLPLAGLGWTSPAQAKDAQCLGLGQLGWSLGP